MAVFFVAFHNCSVLPGVLSGGCILSLWSQFFFSALKFLLNFFKTQAFYNCGVCPFLKRKVLLLPKQAGALLINFRRRRVMYKGPEGKRDGFS